MERITFTLSEQEQILQYICAYAFLDGKDQEGVPRGTILPFNTNNDMILCPQNHCLEAFNIFCGDIEIKGKNLRSNIKI